MELICHVRNFTNIDFPEHIYFCVTTISAVNFNMYLKALSLLGLLFQLLDLFFYN